MSKKKDKPITVTGVFATVRSVEKLKMLGDATFPKSAACKNNDHEHCYKIVVAPKYSNCMCECHFRR